MVVQFETHLQWSNINHAPCKSPHGYVHAMRSTPLLSPSMDILNNKLLTNLNQEKHCFGYSHKGYLSSTNECYIMGFV